MNKQPQFYILPKVTTTLLIILLLGLVYLVGLLSDIFAEDAVFVRDDATIDATTPDSWIETPMLISKIDTPNSLSKPNEGKCYKDVPIYKGNCLAYLDTIGFAKCGSSFVRTVLRYHPNVTSTRILMKHSKYDPNNLEAFFEEQAKTNENVVGKDIVVVGKGFPSFMYNNEKQVEFYSKLYPKVKLLVLLRNPVTRLYSHFGMMLRSKKLTDAQLPFEQWASDVVNNFQTCLRENRKPNWYECDESMILLRGIYVNTISLYMKYFPKENFMFINQEDMLKDSRSTIINLVKWMDLPIPDGWPTDSMLKMVNVGAPRPPMKASINQTLYEFFHPYNLELEKLLNTKFSWT